MSEPFFDLRPTHNPHRWHLQLTGPLCVGPPDRKFMFGGVGLGASIAAMQRTCGRPVVWATAQYLSYAPLGAIVDFDVWVPARGKQTTQARVSGHIGDKEILTVNAAMGARPADFEGQWVVAPDAPPAEACPPADHWAEAIDDVQSRLEARLVKGSFANLGPAEPDGRMVYWMKAKGGVAVDASLLAIIADHVPSGIANALGALAFGNSLDNTIRFMRLVPTEWVLCDVQLQCVHAGFAHGRMLMFSQDGALMAIASQSMIIRKPVSGPAL
jgi:acyl-CoA thioesterase